MNQNFSFKRYVWLLKRQWYENAAIYKWGIALMVLAVGVLFWLTSTWKPVVNPRLGQMETFSVTGMLFLYVYAAWFFDSLSSKHKKMFYFSLPVSSLERIAAAFSCVMVFFSVLYLSVFSVFDFIAVQLFNHIHGTSVQMFFRTGFSCYIEMSLFEVILRFLSIASIFTLGSLMFGKKGLVMSITFMIAFGFIYFWICKWLMMFDLHNQNIVINFHIFTYFLPVCWTMMYFVMKRKEV